MAEQIVVDEATLEKLKGDIDMYSAQLRKAGDDTIRLISEEFGHARIPTLAEWHPSVDSSLENLREIAFEKAKAFAQDSNEMSKALEGLKDVITEYQAHVRNTSSETAGAMSALNPEG